jgi:hypothetical protein
LHFKPLSAAEMADVAACGTAAEQLLRGKECKRRRPLNSGKMNKPEKRAAPCRLDWMIQAFARSGCRDQGVRKQGDTLRSR